MPPIQKFYPALSDLIDASALPGDFQAIESLAQDGIDFLLKRIRYKDLVVDVYSSGDIKYYSLTLLTKSLSLPLFGSGMNLVFFRGSDIDLAEFPIIFEWKWPVSKYIKKFEIQGFSYAPEAFIDILLEMANIESHQDFFNQIINTFLDNGTNAYLNFFDEIILKVSDYDNSVIEVTTEIQNITNQLTVIKNRLQSTLDATNLYTIKDLFENYQEDTLLNDAVDSIDYSIITLRNDFFIDIDIFKNVISALIGEFSNIDEKFKKLLNLFKSWLNEITIQDIKDLLIPQFSLELTNINLALEFPRNLLIPMLEQPAGSGSYIEDPNIENLSNLEFIVGSLKYSTQKGFEFDNQSSFNFQRSLIGKTGMMIEFFNLKVDMSKTYNITEAIIDGRPDDFVGVYAEKASITLPEKWFKNENNPNTTLELSGSNLLIGTGGISGIIALKSIVIGNPITETDYLWLKIGNSGGFLIGFNKFDISLKQNKVISSNITGALEIKKFVYPQGTPNAGQTVRINIDGHLSDDGDFNLTASAAPPYPIVLPEVFTYHLKSVELGKEEDDFYIGTSGTLQFEGFLRNVLNLGPIEIERLRIYSDGSIEFVGGSINLIDPIELFLGPVTITVTAIHYGSHQKEVNGVMRKFNYFGFDGGVSIDPLGIEVRGDGVKYYYCVDDLEDKPKPYLHIQTLYLDLTLPANSGSLAQINGWVTIPEPGISKEYAGGITLQIPSVNLAGKADIKLMPKYPAFIIDCELEPPVPIPLGSFAVYGFRGLLGYRYVAEREAINLTSENSWYEYYKAPKLGINVNKFSGPDRSVNYNTLISLGAGATLGTSADEGYTFSIKAMALFSIPSLFMLDGRANILSARLGLDDTKDPPFFAFVAVGDNSLEFGFGADYKLPGNGKILEVYAEIQAGFFFKNQRPWYVNIGTNINPVSARIISLLDIRSYVMISAKGIEAGARGEFNFERNYKVIKVKAHAFVEVGGKISFERPQMGAYLMAGVSASVKVLFVTLSLDVGILFGVEAPKPFLIYGKFYFKIKVGIKVFGKRITLFKFSGNLEVVWNYNKNIDRTPINPLVVSIKDPSLLSASERAILSDLVQGVNMLSNEPFSLGLLTSKPTGAPDEAILNYVIPLDTYIDIKTQKGLLPGNAADPNSTVRKLIGGINNPPSQYVDLIPPVSSIKGRSIRQVKHQYTIDHLEIKFWNTTKNIWEDYHPYEALYPNALNISNLKIGQFQKTDGQYNALRILATTPFSYTEQGQPGWYVPEQYGINASTLFCQAELRKIKCTNFALKPLNARYYCGNSNTPFFSNNVSFQLITPNEGDYAFITDEPNIFDITKSLAFDNWNSMEILLPQPTAMTRLRVSNFSGGVKVKFYSIIQSPENDVLFNVVYGNPNPAASNINEPHEIILFGDALEDAIKYNFTNPPNNEDKWDIIHANWRPITKIVIEPIFDSTISQQIAILNEQIATIENDNNLISLGIIDGELLSTSLLEEDLRQLICGISGEGNSSSFINRYHKKDKLNYYYSKEFTENNSNFIYAIGTTEKNGLISKINPDGTLLWERMYMLPSDDNQLIFKRIIQIERQTGKPEEKEFQYIVYATTGNKHYLLSFNPDDGIVLWIKYIDWNDQDVFIHIAPVVNTFQFYLTISEKNQIEANKEPLIAIIDSNGEFVMGTLLTVEGKEFIVNSVCENHDGIVVAGSYIGEGFIDSEGIIIKLDNELKILETLKIDKSYTIIHDIEITDNGRYLVSGYDNKKEGIFVCLIDGEGNYSSHKLPNTKNHSSSIQLCEGGFYLLQNDDYNGLLHLFNFDFEVTWSKEIYLISGSNGIRSFTFNRENNKFSFNCYNQSEGSLVVHTDKNLNSCLTNILPVPNSVRTEVTIKRAPVRQEDFELRLESQALESELFNSEIKKYCKGEGCGEENVRVCTLYQQISGIYENCLLHPSLISEDDFDAVILCYIEVLGLIQNFDTAYNLQEHLSNEIQQVNDFLNKKDMQNYTFAWNAIQPILDYLNEIGNCVCECKPKEFTIIHQVCWMSLEDYEYNVNIPSQEAIEEDALAAIQGITQYIQPIWRPDTSYYFHFVLKDNVDNGTRIEQYPYTYGFKTAGPVGYFHTDEKSTYGDLKLKSGDRLLKDDNSYFIVANNGLLNEDGSLYLANSNGFILEDTTGLLRDAVTKTLIFEPSNPNRKLKVVAHPDNYSLTSLKQYIDYNRSYPNADGNLLSAKPLFYNDEIGETTQIYLFFNKAYATHFFHKWESYKNESGTHNAMDGRLKIVIKDPVEDISIVNPPYLNYDPADTIHTHIPQTEEEWNQEANPQIPFAINHYLNLYNAPNCIGGVTVIKPASEYVTIFPKHLKPNKLYSVIVNNLFDVNHNGEFENNADIKEIREVHKFVFKTSRYKDFEQQIKSYFLEREFDGNLVQREAIFKFEKQFSQDELTASFITVKNWMSADNNQEPIAGFTPEVIKTLTNDYQHPYDRVFEGILGLKPWDEPISTEVTILKDTSTNNIIALIVRNPEPFNNPKFRKEVIADTIQVLINNEVDDSYFVLYSKDNSQAIIMNSNKNITENLSLNFKYKIYQDSLPGEDVVINYPVKTEVVLNLDLLNN